MNPFEKVVVKPEWRTSTVVQMCAGMREVQDFSAVPILADALQDAGCDNDPLLVQLRGASDPAIVSGLVAIVYSEETADAARWIEEFARTTLGDSYGYDDDACGEPHQRMDYEILMTHATGFIEDGKTSKWGGETMTQYGGQEWQDQFHDKKEEFWNRYQLVTGSAVPDKKARLFGCSC